MKRVCGSSVALLLLFLGMLVWPWGGLAQEQDAQANRDKLTGNLRNLLIAMHNYHNDYNHLPFHAIYGADQKPLLSWRVTLLPYLGEKELYEQFKLSEPWDSEHNKKLLEKMPDIYAPIGVKPKDKFGTFYQVFTGPDMIFNGQNTLTLGQLAVADGTSNTAMILEAAEAVPWTKPADLVFPAADKKLPKLGSLPNEAGSYACFGDGSVVLISKEITEPLLRQIVGYNDGGNEDPSQYVRRIKE